MQKVEGRLDASSLRLAFIVSRFNSMITDKLLEGSIDFFLRCGGKQENCSVYSVPGSFEIPMAAARVAATGKYDAVVCLGCLIRGETGHYDYIAGEVTSGISRVAIERQIPVTFGVITADTVEQAISRAGLKYGNKGVEAASAAIEMASLYRKIAEADSK
jgi:6,7-dimethyl-8-ribityllumazine synthase